MTSNNRVLFISDIDARKSLLHVSDFGELNQMLGRNTGNQLFTHAIQFYLDQAQSDYDVIPIPRNGVPDIEWSNYSHCIVNVANWLSPNLDDFLGKFSDILSATGLPIFCIGFGAQAGLNEPPTFVHSFKPNASKFLETVLRSGGAFGLRGAYTAECFNELGYKGEYTITGCPSVYQRGPELKITKRTITRDELRPLINGNRQLRDSVLLDHLSCFEDYRFIEQDVLVEAAWSFEDMSAQNRAQLLAWSDAVLKMLVNGKVSVFLSLPDWSRYIQDGGYNFSFGGRVHGNVAAILSGIPAMISTIDSRTRELADFFSFPISTIENFSAEDDLYEYYLASDHTEFNAAYGTRFQNFSKFIDDHNIPLALPTESLSGLGKLKDDENLTEMPRQTNQDRDDQLIAYLEEYLRYRPNKLFSALASKRRLFRLRKQLL